jgi:predicted dehydrogenase
MRFLQIGVGGFGRNWVRWLTENRQTELVGMVDVSPKALTDACQTHGYDKAICYRSLEKALREVDAEAAVVATPPEHHRKPVERALKAGLDVISEKPMADSLADCKAMLRTAKKTGQTYVVSQNYRYNRPTWSMAEKIRKGDLGEIGQVKVDFQMGVDFGGGFRHEMAYPLLVDMSIHHFDLIRFITGLDAVSVSGVAWNPPWSNYDGDCSSNVVFEMENGARVVYTASWCAKGQFNDWNGNWHIEGGKGTLEYNRGEMRFFDVPKLYKVKSDRKVRQKNPPKPGQLYVLSEFLKTRRSGDRPETDVYDNIRSVAMVFAAVKAVKTGRTVQILDKAIKDLIKGT